MKLTDIKNFLTPEDPLGVIVLAGIGLMLIGLIGYHAFGWFSF